LAPDEPDLLGLIREFAPALAAGNTVVAVVSRRWPLRALDLGEVAGVSDVPGGVLNLLCGRMDELLKPLCGHRDVNAIVDAADSGAVVDELAAETVKRVTRPNGDDSLARLEALTELKTAWHPVGS
jgi:acyl-CoA reductase-like NAD-dependent aldehyde dehydrogenase